MFFGQERKPHLFTSRDFDFLQICKFYGVSWYLWLTGGNKVGIIRGFYGSRFYYHYYYQECSACGMLKIRVLIYGKDTSTCLDHYSLLP